MALFGSDARMTIHAYSDEKFQKSKDSISLPFKAETLELSLANQIDGPCLINGTSGSGSYQGGEPGTIDVTFIYDTTIYNDAVTFVAGPALDKKKDLKADLKKLMDAVYTMEGDTHESAYLILKWGEMPMGTSVGGGFYCRLTRMDVKYTLIGGDGKPLVAEVTCRFVENLSKEAQDHRDGKNSPDLTHTRLVREQETLPWKTWEIYQDPGYLVEVARVNGLDSLRRLTPGESLTFPPLEK